jgi:hypothetical protein
MGMNPRRRSFAVPHLSLTRASAIVALALPLITFPALAQLPEVRIADITVTEGNAGSADAVFTVTLSAAATGVVTVAYATEPADVRPATGGASCSGSVDYVTESGTVAFKPNQTSQSLGVAVCGDAAVEENERFRVRLSNPVGATIPDPTGRAIITNDDAAPPALPSVSIDNVSVPEGNAGTATQNATVRLSAATNQSVTVSISAIPGTATGGINCLEGPDFAFLPLPRTISSGQTTLAVPFSVCGNTVFEPNETFTLVLRNPTNATLGDSLGQVTITNDDPEPITVSVRDTTIPESDLGTPEGKYTLTLSRPSTGTVRVDLVVQGGTATFGSGCTGGADFKSVSVGTVEFSPGQTSRQPSFAICSDLNAEPDETFSVTLARPSGAVLGDAVGQITIRNDDIAGQVVPRDEDIVVIVEPARADLSLDMVSLLTQVAPNLAFGVRVRNTGAGAASNVLVRSTLPRDVAFVGLEENTMGTCLQNSTASDGSLQVNCTVPSLPAGGNRGVRILGKVVGTIPDSTQFLFAANVDPNNAIPEGNDTDNTAFLLTTVRAPSDVQVTGKVTSISTRAERPIFSGANCGAGFAIRLDLDVKNNGPYPSRATRIGTVWPRGIVSSESSTCFDSCNVPALNPGQSSTIIMGGLVEANLSAGTRITSTVDPALTILDPSLANNKVTFTCN